MDCILTDCRHMPRPREKCPIEPQKQALARVKSYLDKQDIESYMLCRMEDFYFANGASALEIIEMVSRLIEGHPHTLLLDVARAFFPEYEFRCSSNPSDQSPIEAVDTSGLTKTLFEVAKEACRADRLKLRGLSKFNAALESLIPYIRDRLYLFRMFLRLFEERNQCLFGCYGLIVRVALLLKDEPIMIGTLNIHLANLRCGVRIFQRCDGPSPALIHKTGLIIELVSKQGCHELLKQADDLRKYYFAEDPLKELDKTYKRTLPGAASPTDQCI